MKFSRKLLVTALAVVLLLTLAPLSVAKPEGVDAGHAVEVASGLIEKVAAQSGRPGGKAAWKKATAGTALLVRSVDGAPSEYIVPVIDASGKTISTVGVGAADGGWNWYCDYPLAKFPLVSGPEAVAKVRGWLKERRMSAAVSAPEARIAPDKSIYWTFDLGGRKLYQPAFRKSGPVSDLPKGPSAPPAGSGAKTSASPTPSSSIGALLPGRSPSSAVAPSTSAPGGNAPGLTGSGVATPAASALLPGRRLGAPSSFNISGVPYHAQQRDWWCGPAALEMLFDYSGPDVSQAEIAGVADQDSQYGVYAAELARAAQFSSQSASVQDGTLRGYTARGLGYAMAYNYWQNGSSLFNRRYTDLKELVSSNIPVLVLTYYSNPPSSGHFRVVKGYNDALNVFIVHDPWHSDYPSGPDVNFNQSQFVDTLWDYSNRWGMMAMPWKVDVAKPYTVTAGQTFQVTAGITYPGPSPFEGQYPVFNPRATIMSSSGDYQVSGGAVRDVFGVGATGSSGSASWTVQALDTRKTDDIYVVAEGTVSGSTDAYGYYLDGVGGSGTGAVQPGPTARSWGHDSSGVSSTSREWYLAEGCTAGGFETWVLVQNPNSAPADVSLTYMTSGGPVPGPSVSLAAGSRITFNVADNAPGEYSVSTKVEADAGVVAERAVYAGSRAIGTDSVGASEPGSTWYLAEGCTAGGFETWVLVQNPNDEAANVKLTYMTESGRLKGPSARIPANSRMTFNVADTGPGIWSISTEVTSDAPVVAERAMYGNGRSWGHDSIGAPGLAPTWYLAEGCTQGGFETWVLVQNPNDDPADVTLTYMTEEGQVPGPTVKVPARSRKTFNVAETVPSTWSVSTRVDASLPVVAERAMYGNGRTWGHDSVGVTAPSSNWYLAEGCTNNGFESWVLLQNPNDKPARIEITYMTPAGPVPGPRDSLPANSRKTYCVAEVVPWEWQVSTRVTSDRPIIAERAMYGDAN